MSQLNRLIGRWICLISVVGLMIATSPIDAAQVAKVKGKKILVNLDGEPARKGDIYYLVDSSGKKRAIIKIMAVRRGKAVAVLGKGRARPGFSLQKRQRRSRRKSRTAERPATPRQQKASSGQEEGLLSFKPGTAYWGFMIGMSNSTIDVDVETANTTDTLTGSNLTYKAMFDYNVIDGIWFRGSLGIEPLLAEGDDICGAFSNETCDIEAQYMSLDAYARYVFGSSSFRPWIGGGFSLLFPSSGESTAVEDESVENNTSLITFAGGLDWHMSKTMYIPLQLKYSLLPASETVEGNIISAELGVGFSF